MNAPGSSQPPGEERPVPTAHNTLLCDDHAWTGRRTTRVCGFNFLTKTDGAAPSPVHPPRSAPARKRWFLRNCRGLQRYLPWSRPPCVLRPQVGAEHPPQRPGARGPSRGPPESLQRRGPACDRDRFRQNRGFLCSDPCSRWAELPPRPPPADAGRLRPPTAQCRLTSKATPLRGTPVRFRRASLPGPRGGVTQRKLGVPRGLPSPSGMGPATSPRRHSPQGRHTKGQWPGHTWGSTSYPGLHGEGRQVRGAKNVTPRGCRRPRRRGAWTPPGGGEAEGDAWLSSPRPQAPEVSRGHPGGRKGVVARPERKQRPRSQRSRASCRHTVLPGPVFSYPAPATPSGFWVSGRPGRLHPKCSSLRRRRPFGSSGVTLELTQPSWPQRPHQGQGAV